MSKSLACLTLCALLFAPSLSAEAQQQGKIARVGYLEAGTAGGGTRFKSFQQGLRELGYIEGQNIFVEVRAAEGKSDRVFGLIAELVGLNPDVIVTAGRGAQCCSPTNQDNSHRRFRNV